MKKEFDALDKQRILVLQEIMEIDSSDERSMNIPSEWVIYNQKNVAHLNKVIFTEKPYPYKEKLIRVSYDKDSALKKFLLMSPYVLALLLFNIVLFLIIIIKFLKSDIR